MLLLPLLLNGDKLDVIDVVVVIVVSWVAIDNDDVVDNDDDVVNVNDD